MIYVEKFKGTINHSQFFINQDNGISSVKNSTIDLMKTYMIEIVPTNTYDMKEYKEHNASLENNNHKN